jgi:hypothetical protein
MRQLRKLLYCTHKQDSTLLCGCRVCIAHRLHKVFHSFDRVSDVINANLVILNNAGDDKLLDAKGNRHNVAAFCPQQTINDNLASDLPEQLHQVLLCFPDFDVQHNPVLQT